MAAKTPQPRTYSPSPSSLGTAAVIGNSNGISNGNGDVNGNSRSHNGHPQPYGGHDQDASYSPSPSSLNPIQNQQQYHGFYAPSSQSHHQRIPDHEPDHVYDHVYDHDQGHDQTRSNTLANSHTDHLHAPAPTRPGTGGRFTEEWNANQRGGSVVDGPTARPGSNNMSGLQRSHSVAGSTTSGIGGMDGHSSVQLSRGNTLKKKASLRRSGSLKRSGSRRSMKAGSVRSLALQSNPDEDEMHSAFYCPVPTTGNPTETLANRFQGTSSISSTTIGSLSRGGLLSWGPD